MIADYAIGKLINSNIGNVILQNLSISSWTINSRIIEYSKTQDMDITDQLNSGIRYFDIRLSTTDEKPNNIFLSHGDGLPIINTVPCVDTKNGYNILYFSDVIDECVKFLDSHKKQTIILHISKESVSEKTYNIEGLILNTTFNHQKYSEYFYIGDHIPILDDERGKIVLFTRDNYSNKKLIFNIPIPGMGGCRNYPTNSDSCCPKLFKDYRVQDAYNLDAVDKWIYVKDVLQNNQVCKIGNKFSFGLNFMNMARAELDIDNLTKFVADIFDSSIEQSANYVNTRLTEFIVENPESISRNWFIMDYPNLDSIRTIYQNNAPTNRIFKQIKPKWIIGYNLFGQIPSIGSHKHLLKLFLIYLKIFLEEILIKKYHVFNVKLINQVMISLKPIIDVSKIN